MRIVGLVKRITTEMCIVWPANGENPASGTALFTQSLMIMPNKSRNSDCTSTEAGDAEGATETMHPLTG